MRPCRILERMNGTGPSVATEDVITRAAMFDPMLAADPSFITARNEFVELYSDEPELPEYLACADLARHLIGQLARGDTGHFDEVFNVVERWHLKGDAYVRQAASIGLLEDLQNTALHTTTVPAAFLAWLRPESRRWWDKIEAFWEHSTPITYD